MEDVTLERYGIGFGWRTLEGGRQQSALRLGGFPQELLNVRKGLL
jgi:hypothetical protein